MAAQARTVKRTVKKAAPVRPAAKPVGKAGAKPQVLSKAAELRLIGKAVVAAEELGGAVQVESWLNPGLRS